VDGGGGARSGAARCDLGHEIGAGGAAAVRRGERPPSRDDDQHQARLQAPYPPRDSVAIFLFFSLASCIFKLFFFSVGGWGGRCIASV
jgi:hypothetical protein